MLGIRLLFFLARTTSRTGCLGTKCAAHRKNHGVHPQRTVRTGLQKLVETRIGWNSEIVGICHTGSGRVHDCAQFSLGFITDVLNVPTSNEACRCRGTTLSAALSFSSEIARLTCATDRNLDRIHVDVVVFRQCGGDGEPAVTLAV